MGEGGICCTALNITNKNPRMLHTLYDRAAESEFGLR